MKPLLPVSNKWIKQLGDIKNVAQFFTPFVGDKELNDQYIGQNIELIGMFGNFVTIQFDGNFFLVPSKLIQYLIWSFEKNLASQFSDEDLELICGTSKREKILDSLNNEMERLKKSFKDEFTTCDSKVKTLVSVVDEFLESTSHLEPPDYVFDHIDYEVRT